MEAKTRAWADAAIGLQVPQQNTLVVPYADHQELLKMFSEPDWELVNKHHDPGGKLTGRSAKYNQPRTTFTFVSRNSAPDGTFIQVKVRYGKNGPSNIGWLFCKKVE